MELQDFRSGGEWQLNPFPSQERQRGLQSQKPVSQHCHFTLLGVNFAIYSVGVTVPPAQGYSEALVTACELEVQGGVLAILCRSPRCSSCSCYIIGYLISQPTADWSQQIRRARGTRDASGRPVAAGESDRSEESSKEQEQKLKRHSSLGAFTKRPRALVRSVASCRHCSLSWDRDSVVVVVCVAFLLYFPPNT